MANLAHDFLSQHSIRVQEKQAAKVFSAVNNALDVYFYRLASVLAVLALAHGSRKVCEKEVASACALFTHKRDKRGQRGGNSEGTMMASDYFGASHPAYGQGSLDTNSRTIDFGAYEARPAVSMSGGAPQHAKFRECIRANLKVHNVSISSSALDALETDIINVHIHALVVKLANKDLTLQRVKAILKTKAFAIFA